MRAGLFVSPVSAFAGRVACLRVCVLAIVFVLCIRVAPVAMHTPPQARALGAGRAATRRRPSTWTAMLPLRGKSSVISSDNDFFAGAAAPPGPQRSWSSPGLFERPKSPHFGLLDEWCGRPESETPQLVVGQSAVSSRRKRGSTAPVLLLTLEQLHSELAHATLVPLQIVRASLSGGAV